MPQISKTVRDEVAMRLMSAWPSAVNAAHSTGAYAHVSVIEAAQLASIDWSGGRTQFIQGLIDPDALDDTSTVVPPVVTLAVTEARFTGGTMFRSFSGDVTLLLTFYYEWAKESALAVFEHHLDLIEDAVITSLHDQAWVSAVAQQGLSYKGEIAITRSPITESGENWRQALAFTITFGIDV